MNLKRILHRSLAAILILAFVVSDVSVYAQGMAQMSAPGTMVSLSEAFAPSLLKGVKVYPDNPFRLDFILDKGNSKDSVEQLKSESTRLIKYFLASVTVPENDLWVNLSPYEKDRIIPDAFGVTEMGRDLLAQDYMLKQITASVIYPEGEVGKAFWAKVYAEAEKRYGTTDIPMDTFNKVWIVPERAVVYESTDSAYVVDSGLKVMLEQDYLALEKNTAANERTAPTVNKLGSDIIREVVIPILEKEVNEGKNFAQLRQVYHSLILAIWFKDKIKESILGTTYVDQKKTGGVDIEDKAAKNKIWARYVEAFKKGAYNYIKEDIDPATQQPVPRKYFSGGVGFDGGKVRKVRKRAVRSQLSGGVPDGNMVVQADIAMQFEGLDPAVAVNPLEGFVKFPALRNIFEKIYTQHVVVQSLPRGAEIVRGILDIISRNTDDPQKAAVEVYKFFDFKTDPDWIKADTAYFSKRKDLDFQTTYPELLSGLPEKATILDLGTGPGIVAQKMALARPDAMVFGADVVPQAQTRFDQPNMQFVAMDSPVKIPLPDHSVDLVVEGYLCHHLTIQEMDLLLDEIKRVLKPGGKVFLREPTYSTHAPVDNPHANKEVSRYFQEAVREYGEEFGRAYMAFSEWYSVVLINRFYQWAMPYNFHSLEEWQDIFAAHGMTASKVDFFAFRKAFDDQGLGATQPRGDIVFTVNEEAASSVDRPRIEVPQSNGVVTLTDGLRKAGLFDLISVTQENERLGIKPVKETFAEAERLRLFQVLNDEAKFNQIFGKLSAENYFDLFNLKMDLYRAIFQAYIPESFDRPHQEWVDFLSAEEESSGSIFANQQQVEQIKRLQNNAYYAYYGAWFKALAAQVKRPVKILIIGPGSGNSLRKAMKEFPNAEITVLDIEPAVIDRLRLEGFKNVKFVVSDAVKTPLETQGFDVVTVEGVLRYVAARGDAVLGEFAGELARLVKKDGVLYMQDGLITSLMHQFTTVLEDHGLMIREWQKEYSAHRHTIFRIFYYEYFAKHNKALKKLVDERMRLSGVGEDQVIPYLFDLAGFRPGVMTSIAAVPHGGDVQLLDLDARVIEEKVFDIPQEWSMDPDTIVYDENTDITRKALPTKYAAAVVILNEKGEVLFTKRNPLLGGMWGLPSSYISEENDPKMLEKLAANVKDHVGVDLKQIKVIGKRMGYRVDENGQPWQLLMDVVFATVYSGTPKLTGNIHVETGMPKHLEMEFLDPKVFLSGHFPGWKLETASDCTKCFGTIVFGGFEQLQRANEIEIASEANKAAEISGGIDLTPKQIGLQVEGLSQGVQFNFDPAMIQRLQSASGFTPVIMDIQPMTTTVPMFLGLKDEAPVAGQLSMK